MANERAGHHGRTLRRVNAGALLMLIGVLAVVAAGCGSRSDKTANEAYANSVCSAIGTWEHQIKSIVTDLSGGVSKGSLQSKISQTESATKTLTKQIKALPPPTSDGQAVKTQVDQLATELTKTVDAAQSAVAPLPSNASATTIAAALAPLAPQVQGLANAAQSTVKGLQTASGSLASAFKSAGSCKNLKA
jgi:hypothetical protein